MHNLLKFLTNFIIDFQNFRAVFPNIPLIVFQLRQILLKPNTFSNFRHIFFDSSSVTYLHLINFFVNFSNYFSMIYSKVSIKLQLKFAQIFILVNYKIFLRFSEVFLNFFRHSNYFSQNINCQ